MNILQSVFLGIIQGLTEFLPVSSSGHLVLVQQIMHISGPALFFDTLLHGGTLIAVFIALRRDIWNILRRPLRRLTLMLAFATAVTAGFAFLLKDAMEEAFASARWLGPAFLITAAALFFAEFRSRTYGKFKNEAEMGWFDALLIGALQGLAIIPGISRSGFTLAGALSRRLERDLAARFSFLLSIPAIVGALVFQIREIMKIAAAPSVNPGSELGIFGGIDPAAMAAGTLTAALVGFGAVTLMLRIIRKRSLMGFGIYTALLGLLILADQFITHLVF
ncbi:MAG: undecaprenyl-diphosphate phosphatase [Treponema sp.]|jgi:undecaprenyl-diphosphatase|nr:undecaprenyl-diphosphate phosphatase [Treponema sp.]